MNIQKRMLLVLAFFLFGCCTPLYHVYKQNIDSPNPRIILEDSLLVCRILHNRQNRNLLESAEDTGITFKFKISDLEKRHAKGSTEVYAKDVKGENHDGYVFIFHDIDKEKKKDKYVRLTSMYFDNKSGDLSNLQGNKFIYCKYGDITFLGTYIISIIVSKGLFSDKDTGFKFLHLEPKPDELENAYTAVIKKFKGTKFEKIAQQKLTELKGGK